MRAVSCMEKAVKGAERKLRILAVADPAVQGYPREKILENAPVPCSMDILPWKEYYPAMMESFQGRRDYDIVMVAGHLWLKELVDQGFLAPVDEPEADLLPGLRHDLCYENTWYLVPSFFDGHIIVYRRELAETLWPLVMSPQEYMQRLEKLYASGKREFLAIKADTSEIFTDALPFLRMDGGDAYDEDGRVVCSTPEAVQGLQAYCRLKKYALPGTDSFGNEEVMRALLEKKALVAITWSGQLGLLGSRAAEFGFSVLTTGWNTVWSFGINRRSDAVPQCRQLLRYLSSAAVDRRVSIRSGTPLHAGFYAPPLYPWCEAQQRMTELARALPYISRAGEKNAVFYGRIAQAFAGRISPKEAMQQAEAQLRSLQD